MLSVGVFVAIYAPLLVAAYVSGSLAMLVGAELAYYVGMALGCLYLVHVGLLPAIMRGSLLVAKNVHGAGSVPSEGEGSGGMSQGNGDQGGDKAMVLCGADAQRRRERA